MEKIKFIKLTQGQYAIVSSDDYYKLSKLKWHAHRYKNYGFYAETNIRVAPGRLNGSFKIMKMHRLILKAKKNQVVDHIDQDTLDNRRSNIRLCSIRENSRNKTKFSKNKSNFKGVSWHKASNRWIAQIGCSNNKSRKNVYLGVFKRKIDAAKVYDDAAKKYHKEFARLNFP